MANHREHRLGLRHAVDLEVGIEDLVAAMLGIGLREHHQLDVGRIATDAPDRRLTDSRFRRRTAPVRVHDQRPAAHPVRAPATRPAPAAVGGRRTTKRHRSASSNTVSIIRSNSGGVSASRSSPAADAARVAQCQLVVRPTFDASHSREPTEHARCPWLWSTTAKSCRDAAPPRQMRQPRQASSGHGRDLAVHTAAAVPEPAAPLR